MISAAIIGEKILDFSADLIFSGSINVVSKIKNNYTIKSIINRKDIENNGKIENIEQYVLDDVENTIKKAFHKNQIQETIKEILVNTENHKAFCEYLIRQGEIRTEKNDEDGYSTLIKLFVDGLYKDETLQELIPLLNEERLKLIQIESSNVIINILSQLLNEFNRMNGKLDYITKAIEPKQEKENNQAVLQPLSQPPEIQLRDSFLQYAVKYEIEDFLVNTDLPCKISSDTIIDLDSFQMEVDSLIHSVPLLKSSSCYINIIEFMGYFKGYSKLLAKYSTPSEKNMLITIKGYSPNTQKDIDDVNELKLKALKSYETICYL